MVRLISRVVLKLFFFPPYNCLGIQGTIYTI